MIVQSSDGMRAFEKVEIQIPQQAHFMRTDKLGDHFVWFVDGEITMGHFDKYSLRITGNFLECFAKLFFTERQ